MARIFLVSVVLVFIHAAVAAEPFQIPEPRIVHGENATESDFPFMVALRTNRSSPGVFCGGTILTSSNLLTAAHCCKKIQQIFLRDFYVYSGSIYLSKGGTNHSIEKVTVHQSYEPNLNWVNDYCIIKVSPSFNISKTNKTTLASYDYRVEARDRVAVAGWGLITPSLTNPVTPDGLQKGVNFVMLSNMECQHETGLQLYGSQICARGARGWQATWMGDSGGPLLKNGVQIGLTSFGYRPSGARLPTIYASVMDANGWIQQSVGSEADQLVFASNN